MLISKEAHIQRAISFGERILYGLRRRDHATPALHGLGWPTVDELIVDRDLANVRQILVSATALLPNCYASCLCCAPTCPPVRPVPWQTDSSNCSGCAQGLPDVASIFEQLALGMSSPRYD